MLDMIVDATFAFRVEPADEILYKIVLRAPADRHAKDIVVLESLIKSFKAIPLPEWRPRLAIRASAHNCRLWPMVFVR